MIYTFHISNQRSLLTILTDFYGYSGAFVSREMSLYFLKVILSNSTTSAQIFKTLPTQYKSHKQTLK